MWQNRQITEYMEVQLCELCVDYMWICIGNCIIGGGKYFQLHKQNLKHFR